MNFFPQMLQSKSAPLLAHVISCLDIKLNTIKKKETVYMYHYSLCNPRISSKKIIKSIYIVYLFQVNYYFKSNFLVDDIMSIIYVLKWVVFLAKNRFAFIPAFYFCSFFRGLQIKSQSSFCDFQSFDATKWNLLHKNPQWKILQTKLCWSCCQHCKLNS